MSLTHRITFNISVGFCECFKISRQSFNRARYFFFFSMNLASSALKWSSSQKYKVKTRASTVKRQDTMFIIVSLRLSKAMYIHIIPRLVSPSGDILTLAIWRPFVKGYREGCNIEYYRNLRIMFRLKFDESQDGLNRDQQLDYNRILGSKLISKIPKGKNLCEAWTGCARIRNWNWKAL